MLFNKIFQSIKLDSRYILLILLAFVMFPILFSKVWAQQTVFQGWGVVVGADTTPQAAKFEASSIKTKLSVTPSTYVCNSWYRTVFVTRDRAAAVKLLTQAQRKVRVGSYLVDMRIWCPGKKLYQ